jgi:hypothetical protein
MAAADDLLGLPSVPLGRAARDEVHCYRGKCAGLGF